MKLLTQKINVRMALIVALIGVFLSIVGSITVFSLALDKQQTISYRLVNQLAASAVKTAAIAVYVDDTELANEIINGLATNDLVSAARINTTSGVLASNLHIQSSDAPIEYTLYHPFIEDEGLGRLDLFPDATFIEALALEEARGSALQILLVSFFITVAIAGTMQYTLSRPLIQLKQAFENVDPSNPGSLEKIDIQYVRQDELGYLIDHINGLIRAVRSNFLAERKLRVHTEKLEQQLRLLFEKASVGVALISTKKGILIENPAFNRIVGVNSSLLDFIGMFDDAESVKNVIETIKSSQNSKPVTLDLSYQADGSRRWVHCLFAAITEQRMISRDDDDLLFEVIVNDITERKELEAEINYQAQHDSLTGLYNRLGGERHLHTLLDNESDNSSKALLLIDLDKFKPINDTYGHDAGDIVLKVISQRIKTLFNESADVCIRWGGDEFVVGFKRLNLPRPSLETLCNALLHSLEEPIDIGEQLVSVSASIGVVILHLAQAEFRPDLDYYLNKADEAMYRVKHEGRSNYLIV